MSICVRQPSLPSEITSCAVHLFDVFAHITVCIFRLYWHYQVRFCKPIFICWRLEHARIGMLLILASSLWFTVFASAHWISQYVHRPWAVWILSASFWSWIQCQTLPWNCEQHSSCPPWRRSHHSHLHFLMVRNLVGTSMSMAIMLSGSPLVAFVLSPFVSM